MADAAPDVGVALDALAARTGATLSVWAGGADGHCLVERAADVVHPTASTLKLPLLVAVLRADAAGRLPLDHRVRVRDRLPRADGTGEYVTTHDYDNDDEPWRVLGAETRVGWLAERAVVRSSNLATNLLLDLVGTTAIDAVLEAAGATATRIARGIQDPSSVADNVTTARDCAAVVAALVRGDLLGERRTAYALDVLERVEHRDAMVAGLPGTVRVAHKPGWFDGVCHDVGVAWPPSGTPRDGLVVAVLTASPLDENAGHALVADATALCWDAARPTG